MTLKQGTPDKQIRLTEKLVEKAEKTCMISKAIRGNVELGLEPVVRIGE